MSKKMKAFRLVTFSFTALLIIILGLSGALYVYFDDARIQKLITEIVRKDFHLELSMKDFNLRLLKGVEIDDITIKPISISEEHPLSVKRIEVLWSPWSLLKGKVLIKRIHIENPTLNIINTKLVQNFRFSPTQVPKKSSTPKAASPQKKKREKETPFVWQPPNSPIKIEIRDFALKGLNAKYQSDDYVFTIQDINLNTHLTLQNTDLHGHITFLTGQTTSKPNFVFDMPEKKFALKTLQKAHMQVTIESYQNIKTDIQYKSTNTIQHEKLSTEIPIMHALLAISNIEKQHLKIQKLQFKIGDFAETNLELSLLDALEKPRIIIEKVNATIKGENLQKALSTVFPNAKIQGDAYFEIDPTTIALAPLDKAFEELKLKVSAETKQLTCAFSNFGIKNHNLALELEINNGQSNLESTQTIEQLSLPTGSIENIMISTNNTFALKELIQTIKTSATPFQFTIETLVKASDINIKPLRINSFELTNQTHIPLQYILNPNPLFPLESTTKLQLKAIRLNPVRIKKSTTNVLIKLWDKTLMGVDIAIQGSLSPILMAFEESIKLNFLKYNLNVQKENNTLKMTRLDYNLANLLKGTFSLQVNQIDSATPQISNAALRIKDFKLAGIADVLSNILPQGKYEGTLSGELDLHMRMPNPSELKTLSLTSADTFEANTVLQNISKSWTLLYQKLGLQSRGRFNIENLSLDLPEIIKLTHLNLLAITKIDATGLQLKSNLRIKKILAPVEFKNFSSRVSIELNKKQLVIDPVLSLHDYVLSADLLPLKKIKTSGRIKYLLDDEILFEDFSLQVDPLNISGLFSGNIKNSLAVFLSGNFKHALQDTLQSHLKGRLTIANKVNMPLLKDDWMSKGDLGFKGELRFKNGLLALSGALSANHFNLKIDNMAVSEMIGKLPYTFAINFKAHPLSIPIIQNMGLSDLPIGLQTPETALKRGNTQTSYFSRQDSYANQSGLFIGAIQYGNYKIKNFLLDASLNQTSLNARHFAMNVLGGDIIGNAAFQLNSDRSIAGIFNTQVSNIDASYFPALEMKPGKESELSANIYADFILGASIRDLNMDMNITKIGSKTLNRFVLLLDPEKKDKQLQANRKNLRWIQIDQVNTWIRRENLNMDLYYTALLRIPWTRIGFRPINTEMLRRYRLSEFMDVHIQGQELKPLRKALGW